MKFAKELSEEAIPEWRANYLDYKTGKKRLKAIARAVRNVPSQSRPKLNTPGNSLRDAPVLSFLKKRQDIQLPAPHLQYNRSKSDPRAVRPDDVHHQDDPERAEGALQINERSPLQTKRHGDVPGAHTRLNSYGSILGSPPHSPALKYKGNHAAPSLELPAPAVESQEEEEHDDGPVSPTSRAQQQPRDTEFISSPEMSAHPPATQMAHHGNAYEARPPHDEPISSAQSNPRLRSLFSRRANSTPGPFMKRMLSTYGDGSPKTPRDDQDVALEAYREVDFRQHEFFLFLDKELSKINTFYQEKEDEADDRLEVLRKQLHIMRELRLEEILAGQGKHPKHPAARHAAANGEERDMSDHGKENGHQRSTVNLVTRPFAKSVDLAADAVERIRRGHVGKTSRARQALGSPSIPSQPVGAGSPGTGWVPRMDQRDYVRKGDKKDVPYRTAKRQMKLAMAEFYRGLELVKSYAMLNRTAFRKITKKYNKTINGAPTHYMDEKVNKAYFVTSDKVDTLMSTTEDLYARYFEKGHHKVAVSKLRAKSRKFGDYTGSIARSCALLGAGVVFGVEGLVKAAENLFIDDPHLTTSTSYALQIYGGYFLMWLLAFLFMLCCFVFQKFKVNYQFIFELEKRTALDWRQAIEIPSWLFFMLGITLWLNFDLMAGGYTMYVYWPVVLVGLTLVSICLPAKIFYWRARKWLLYSIWRLSLAGLYSVEFRDFFLGDMFCSLTYAVGNIELYFCLYAHKWNDPVQCNSSHSRLLGFFTAMPGIWRALQCLRRYYETHDVFPHLVNCGKYCFTIMQYVSLSLYRLDQTPSMLALFCSMSAINSVYCIVWDIFMDFSLGDFRAKHKGLRKTLVYRKYLWMYYAIIVVDPILRCNWIPYAVYTQDVQHSTIVSFMVGFSEVCRRAMWTLFRVENEQATNIERGRASRDLPLPYKLPEEDEVESASPRSSADDGHEDNRGDTSSDDIFKPKPGDSPWPVHTHMKDYVTKRNRDQLIPTDEMSSLNLTKNQSTVGEPLEDVGTKSQTRKSPGKQSPGQKRTGNRKVPSTLDGVTDSPNNARLSPSATRKSSNTAQNTPSGRDVERGDDSPSNALQRIGNAMRAAHAVDYQRKKKPVDGDPDADGTDDEDDDSDDD